MSENSSSDSSEEKITGGEGGGARVFCRGYRDQGRGDRGGVW